jgi:hypothetical protein
MILSNSFGAADFTRSGLRKSKDKSEEAGHVEIRMRSLLSIVCRAFGVRGNLQVRG